MSQPTSPTLKRRTVFAGVGTAGALAAAATLLPRAPEPAEKQATVRPDAEGGYQLTEHVKQYYAKARV